MRNSSAFVETRHHLARPVSGLNCSNQDLSHIMITGIAGVGVATDPAGEADLTAGTEDPAIVDN